MDYPKFFKILMNILFFLIGTGLVTASIAFSVIVHKSRASRKRKKELPKPRRAAPLPPPLYTLTKSQLDELLFQLEKEKRAIAFGFHKMSSTHTEVAKARLQKIEERMLEVKALSATIT